MHEQVSFIIRAAKKYLQCVHPDLQSSGKVLIRIRKSIPFRFVSFFSIVFPQSVSHTFLFNEEKEKVRTIVEGKAILKCVRVRPLL